MNCLAEQARSEIAELMKASCALARKDFWWFCQIMHPRLYTDDKLYLKDLCDKLQDFIEKSPKQFLVINLPPRHMKSLTAQNFTAWLFGKHPDYKIMTASYNERLSGLFARTVRNTIQTEKIDENLVYADIFDATVKYGEASASMWTLDGQNQVSYLATSPGSTATGLGANIIICDDLIKSAEEAYNETALENTWLWFTNTMMQRLEAPRKVIVVMTRWAKGDLAGRIIEAYGDDVEIVAYKAVQDDGTMLCNDILDKKSYDLIVREMNLDIAEANYNQQPIDVGGRLYQEFKTWQDRPDFDQILNYTDTADTGKDFTCSINYGVYENEAYILDLVHTDEPMEITEPAVARLLSSGGVNVATIESNNGGRGFARNVEAILRQKNINKTTILSQSQTKNKESRILASSAWVQNHVYMPSGWQQRYPEFHKQVMSYQRKGKNNHDDAPDVLAAIYELVTEDRRPQFFDQPSTERVDRALNF